MISKLLGIIGNIIGILSLWGITEEKYFVWRVIVSVFIVLVTLLIVFYEEEKSRVIDYYWPPNGNLVIMTRKNKSYYEDGLVSIYKKGKLEVEDKIVAIGTIRNSPNWFNCQIAIYQSIDQALLEEIKDGKKAYCNYYVKPYVSATKIDGIKI